MFEGSKALTSTEAVHYNTIYRQLQVKYYIINLLTFYSTRMYFATIFRNNQVLLTRSQLLCRVIPVQQSVTFQFLSRETNSLLEPFRLIVLFNCFIPFTKLMICIKLGLTPIEICSLYSFLPGLTSILLVLLSFRILHYETCLNNSVRAARAAHSWLDVQQKFLSPREVCLWLNAKAQLKSTPLCLVNASLTQSIFPLWFNKCRRQRFNTGLCIPVLFQQYQVVYWTPCIEKNVNSPFFSFLLTCTRSNIETCSNHIFVFIYLPLYQNRSIPHIPVWSVFVPPKSALLFLWPC